MSDGNDLLARATARGFRDCYVTARDWCVGGTSGTGIDGTILSVHRPWTVEGPFRGEHCPTCSGRAFPVSDKLARGMRFHEAMEETRREADAVALAHGHLVLFSATKPGIETMRNYVENGWALSTPRTGG